MNEIRTAGKRIRSLIRGVSGLDDGMAAITEDMRRIYRFSDVGKFNRASISECYRVFEEWLNGLVVSRPMPQGITALYFGLCDTDEGIVLHVSGSCVWDEKDPDWACRSDWLPEEGSIRPAIYRDISMVLSRHSYLGYYLALAVLVVMIKQYVATSMISLLDRERQSLCIACGFDNGELYNVGELFDDGLMPPYESGMWLP